MAVDVTVWGIHAGTRGEADDLFVNENVVALSWAEVGDLSQVPSDRNAFKALVTTTYPGMKPAAVPGRAGQLYRFVHEVALGDFVVYPSKLSRLVHVGRVSGAYGYSVRGAASFPHRRAVEWLAESPRTHFSQGALYEIGSAMGFFQVKNYADEFQAAATGESSVEVVDEDESVAVVAGEIEQTTRDFVLKELAKELKGHPLAEFVAHLLEAMGYRTRVSSEGPDAGVDVLAHRDELGFEPPIIKVQVKSTEGSVGDPVVSQLYGKVGDREFGLFVTLGTFTPPARAFERGKGNLRLVDGDQLVELVLEHYESFDSRYKGLLPLRRVYVPQPLSEP